MPRITKAKENPIFTPISNKIGDRRYSMNQSLVDTAQELRMTPGSYGSIESGHALPSWAILQRMCEYFSCEPTDLYTHSWILAEIQSYWEVEVPK